MGSLFRRIRGSVGNAVVWGATWFAGAFVAYGGLSLFGVLGYGLGAVLEASLNLGIIGAAAGLGFSGFVRWRYLAKSLADLRLGSFAAAGALGAGIFVPVIVALGRVLTGAPALDVSTLASSGLVAALLGGSTAGISLAAAQSGQDQLGPSHRPDGQLRATEEEERALG